MSQLDLESFKTKISITIDSENYLVKTASTPEDLKLALKLRHQVFFEEGLNKTHETGLEFDSYDQIADHLLIIDKNNGQIAGTYRLIHSDFADSFYSENEFVLDQFLKIDGRKLEMVAPVLILIIALDTPWIYCGKVFHATLQSLKLASCLAAPAFSLSIPNSFFQLLSLSMKKTTSALNTTSFPLKNTRTLVKTNILPKQKPIQK